MKWKCDKVQQEGRKTSRTRGRKTATKALQFGWFWAHGIKEMCPGKGDRWKTPRSKIHSHCRFHRLEARLTYDTGHARAKYSPTSTSLRSGSDKLREAGGAGMNEEDVPPIYEWTACKKIKHRS